MTTARENMESSPKAFRFESETEHEKEKREMIKKRVKMGGILILWFLLLNFVLVLVAMNRTSEISSESLTSTRDFSAAVKQTNETGEIVDEMKFKLDGMRKWKKSTEEKLESHQFQIEVLSNQTKIDKEMEALENENRQLQKSQEELKEQFELLSKKFDQLESSIPSSQNVSFVTTSPPNLRETTEENKDPSPIDPKSIKSCSSAMEILSSPRSQKQRIHPHGNRTSLEVLCDFETDGGGWTIIQKRSRGPKEEFKQNWTEYQNGFGSLDGNFWLGLENIRALTQNGDQELRIELEDFSGEKRYAKYSSFSISDASNFYRLTLSGFFGNSTAGDSMASHISNNGQRFSTKDKDNAKFSYLNCAAAFSSGGWWFASDFGYHCGGSVLNGLYYEKGEAVSSWSGIYWHSWKGETYSLAKTEMKIRIRKS